MCMFWNYQLKVHDFKDFLFIFFILHVFTQLFFSWKLLVTNDPVEESGVFVRHVDIVFYENDTASTDGDSVFLYENDSSEQCPTCDDFIDGSVFMNFFNESNLPGGVVMLYKKLQKFADKMNHERTCWHLTSLDSYFVSHIV